MSSIIDGGQSQGSVYSCPTPRIVFAPRGRFISCSRACWVSVSSVEWIETVYSLFVSAYSLVFCSENNQPRVWSCTVLKSRFEVRAIEHFEVCFWKDNQYPLNVLLTYSYIITYNRHLRDAFLGPSSHFLNPFNQSFPSAFSPSPSRERHTLNLNLNAQRQPLHLDATSRRPGSAGTSGEMLCVSVERGIRK